ncbi:MAG: ABC transporter substrate-binding protein [Micrococcales bacterium]
MKKLLAVTGVVAASALLIAGCSSNTASTPTPSETQAGIKVDAAAAALLPASYKTKGINAGSDIPYAPMEMFDANNNPIGFDVDLINAIGAKLGVKVTVEKQSFDTLIPSLQSGTHDVAMSSMSDTIERQAKLDFVDYFNGGASLMVAKGNPKMVTSLDSLCGETVAAEKATWEVDLLNTQSKTCTDAGKKAINIQALPGDTDAQNAVRSGNAVAYLADSQLAAYNVKVAGNGSYFDLVIDPKNPNGYESGLIGVGVLKANSGLTKAIQAALQSLMDDGTYDSLLNKWNLDSFKVGSATINGTK